MSKAFIDPSSIEKEPQERPKTKQQTGHSLSHSYPICVEVVRWKGGKGEKGGARGIQ